VQAHAEAAGYGVVRDLVGHGVGHEVHEDPQVPNYKTRAAEKIVMKPGLVIAIEPMITIGDYHIDVLNDGWTIVTKDRSYSAHWEHTIAVTEEGSILITDL
jgi:methionyl aminopeptidase